VSQTPLIPRKVLFGNPDRVRPSLSPDGRYMAWLAPVDGVLNVWVGPLEDIRAAEPVTRDTERGVRYYVWPHTGEHVLYIQDRGGDENWRVYSTDLQARETRDLTPFDEVAAQIEHVSHRVPEEILVGLNRRDARYHDLHRLNVRTGELELIQENPEFAGFVTDDDLEVRFAVRVTSDGGNQILRPDGEGGWEEFVRVGRQDAMTTGPVGFDKAGRVLYLRDSRGRDTAALAALDLETGEERVLAEDDRVDVGGVLRHPTGKHLEAVEFNYERPRWEVLDPAIGPDFERMRRLTAGQFWVASRTLDDRHWIVGCAEDTAATRYYHYDRTTEELRFLFSSREDLADRPLVPMRPAVIPARDGLELVSYYTLPPGAERAEGLPALPLPAVLLVHGGPWGRSTWGLDSMHQWLANRGYAVLDVNFRGSTGFGKAFVNAGDLEWGRKMHEDLIDAVRWAVEEGIADPERVAIMGGSYGGYATLVGLTFTPETFACGVDIVGPSNLLTLLKTIPPYWTPVIEMFANRVGDPDTEEGRRLLEERSPLHRAEQIRRPLLIGQGANDPRVKQAESDQIVEAMQKKGIPVTYVLYPDEGHGFARPENRLSFFAAAEAFLSEHLGGRYEEVGEDFAGSSITAPVGAGEVPGLEESLAEQTERS
jgi:dipeptidyl aminopeptidase/acylaminoacyl peptidase